MRARKVNFFYDHLLVKEPGTEAPTGWHQDQNYWPFSGRDICSIWAPLDAVDRHNGTLEFVAGSHRWHDRPMTRKPLFGRRPGQPQDLADADAAAVDDGPPQPDIEADRGAYRILCWDLEPGDAVAFTGMTLHYASANPGRGRRRALSTRWLGDDIRFLRKQRMLQMIREPGLRTGDAVDCELFPAVWQRDGA
jgi:ectoine hydroxylase-related dioxygenase (phytanoyl-CoA dioxygenase family)